jgi:HlyD family secretion protein
MYWLKRLIVLIAIVSLGLGGYYWYRAAARPAEVQYRTAAIKRGDLVAAIGATGTVEPEEVIDVGAQVAGQIQVFGKDVAGAPIDYRSEVEAGMVLAKIDDAVYVAEVTQAQAQVDQAEASIARAQAEVQQLKARLAQAQREWERAQKLGPSDALSQASYETFQSAFEVAQANMAVGEASVLQARATRVQAQAALDRASRNLGFCTIKSPVKGVIIDRRVNIGQTVVASLNAPSLFLIAQDLRRMQVWVAVNEADIGSIRPQQRVTFTVDALPGRVFEGRVRKVRLNATFTSNVVTYTVEVTTDNSDGALLPYLTANAQFETGRRQDVLMVPNAALRWSPPETAPSANRDSPGGADATTRPAGRRGGRGREDESRGSVWVLEQGSLRLIEVTTGLSDGAMTEVSAAELREGMEVVLGEQAASATRGGSGGANPFIPQVRRGTGGGRGR